MNRIRRMSSLVAVTQKGAHAWRTLWILMSLGLLAAGAGAPGSWDIP